MTTSRCPRTRTACSREAEEYIENNVDREVDEHHEKLIAPPDLNEKIVEDQEPAGHIGSLILRERLVGDNLLRVRRDRCEPGLGGAENSVRTLCREPPLAHADHVVLSSNAQVKVACVGECRADTDINVRSHKKRPGKYIQTL